MTAAQHAIANRSLYVAIAELEQQAREYQHCLDTSDTEGMLRAGTHLRNLSAFLCGEATDIVAAVRQQQKEVRP